MPYLFRKLSSFLQLNTMLYPPGAIVKMPAVMLQNLISCGDCKLPTAAAGRV